MKSLIPAVSLISLLALASVSACDSKTETNAPGAEVSSEQLKAGGVYIAYMNGCEKGCDQLAKGDLILEVDGKPVTSAKDMRTSRLATGAPIKLKVLKSGGGEPKEIEIVAQPKELPPLKDVPPFWSVGAADLDKAPQWARRNLFGHASPMTMLVSAEGGITDGRQLHGKKRLILFWDWATRDEQAQAANMMQLLQLAQDDLKAAGVEVMFTQIKFPTNADRQLPMNDTALRDFQTKYGVAGKATLPMYRFPNATEYNASRELGLEGSTTYIQYLRQPPAIILLDEGGIVRWHSEGIQTATDPDYRDKDDQFTIMQAISFARKM
jgi:hypothetical protein